MKRLICILLCVMPFLSFAQPGVASVKDVDGKRFYEHKVEAGNTLWGISRMYGVPVDEIVAVNPKLVNGLKLDETVLIPVTQASIEKIPTSDYKVRKSETLYGLSRKFEVTVDDLIALNPSLKDGLKKGQIIKVPMKDGAHDPPPKVEPTEELPKELPNPFVSDTLVKEDGTKEQVAFSFSDSTIRHVVMAHETMYSVSKRFMVPIDRIMKLNGLKSASVKEGQVLVIPVTNERIERVEIKDVPDDWYDPEGEGPLEFAVKEEYHVVMMLPLHLESGATYSKRVSDLATKFYMGAKLALDSLAHKGLNAKVTILDTKNDSLTVMNLLADDSLLTADLIIAPFFEKNVRMVADYCRANKIRLITPTSVSSELVESNRLVYQAVPSPERLMIELADHMITNNAKDLIVLVKPEKKSDLPMYNAYLEAFKSNDSALKPTLVESTMGSFTGQVRRGINIIFVVPSNDKRTAMKFMNALNRKVYQSTMSNLYVYGTKDWNNYSDISNLYKNRFHFTYASPNFLNYYTDEVKELNKLHRSIYKTDLSRMAVHGYDITMSFCAEFFLEGSPKQHLMMSKFEMEQSSLKGGYENTGLFVIEQDDFELFDTEFKDD